MFSSQVHLSGEKKDAEAGGSLMFHRNHGHVTIYLYIKQIKVLGTLNQNGFIFLSSHVE